MRCWTVRTRSMETTSWSAIVVESASSALILLAEIAPMTTSARITTPKPTPRRYASLRLLKRDTGPPGGIGVGREMEAGRPLPGHRPDIWHVEYKARQTFDGNAEPTTAPPG